MKVMVRIILAAALWPVLSACDDQPVQPVLVRTCGLSVNFPRNATTSKATLAHTSGQLLNVSRQGLLADDTDRWHGSVDLPAGRVLYWIEVDGRRQLDPHNPLTMIHEGQRVSVAYVSDCRRGRFRLVKWLGTSAHPRIMMMLERGVSRASLDADHIEARTRLGPLPIKVEGDHVTIDAGGLPPGKYYLELKGQDTDGHDIDVFRHPFWVETKRFRWNDATIYQVVLDRFATETGAALAPDAALPGERFGGHLKGLLAHLKSDFFEASGANVLWLSPLYQNADGLWKGVEGGPPRYESYHGYWPIHPRKLDARVGTADDLDAVVAEAHRRGIRVLVDVVPNHIHEDHIYRTEHPEWTAASGCVCGAPDCPWWREIKSCWFTPYMPDIDWSAEGVLEQTVSDMVWWMKRFDLDGLRIDAVPMIPRFVTRLLTHKVADGFEGLGTRQYLVGETFTGPDGYDDLRTSLGAFGLDGQFDFPLMWALREAFAWRSAPLWQLIDQWAISQQAWAGSAAVMAHMVGNHDVNRFVSEAMPLGGGGYDAWTNPAPAADQRTAHESLRLAVAFVMTMPGVSVLYYGDEIGIAGGRDPDNRRPMRFEDQWNSLERQSAFVVRRLGRLKRCMAPFARDPVHFLKVDAERLAYARSNEEGDAMVIVLNRAPIAPQMDLQLAEGDTPATRRMVDVLSGHAYDVIDGIVIGVSTRPGQIVALIDSDHPCHQEDESL
ncbi:MAG: alpha-amylase family glycosyl hydrolase [Myxococcota bacterium]|nr:alpha-amylase family glycosyl hydrolase [Myxococcota bacterium]